MALTKVTGHVVKPDTNIQFHNTKSTGIVTFAHTSNATSSTTGALQITGGVGIVKDLHVGGNVTVGGTLTYDDVTNIDSLGIVTARGGIHVGPITAGVATVYTNGNASFTGIVTATSFVGGLPITDGADNRVITAASASAIQGEANLTYNGSNLQFNTTANGNAVILKSTGNYYNKLSFDSGNTSAGGELAYVDFSWDGDKVADIQALAGSDTTNKDDGHLVFRTSASQGNIAERLRITSGGTVNIGGDYTNTSGKLKVTGNINVATGDIAFLNNAHKIHNSSSSGNVTIQGGATYAGGKIYLSGGYGSGGGTGDIRFYADGTTTPVERLRIGSNGSVGIGTDYLSGNNSVYHKLMVEGDTTSAIAVAKILRRNSSASNSTYTFEVDSSAHTSNMTSGGAMSVNVNSGRAFTIDGNGQVGIGTDLPKSGSPLHIHGTGASDKPHIRITADRGLVARLGDTSGSAQAMFDLYDTDGSTQIVRFISGGGQNFINTGGSLGIGTATVRSSRAMQLTGASNSIFLLTGNAPAICLNRDSDDSTDSERSYFGVSSVSNGFANGTSAGDTILRGNSTGKIMFATGTSIRARITADGCFMSSNIGLGVDNRWKIRPNNTNADLAFEYSTSTTLADTNIKMNIDSGGSVSIGDAATHTYSAHSEGDDLVIGGSGWRGMTIYGEGGGGVIQFADDGSNRIGQIMYNHSDNSMMFRTGGNQDRLTISSSGTIQIGGAVENSGDLDASNTRLTIKQSANSQEDGIYIERSGERRGYYMYVGGAGGYSDALCITTNQLGTDSDILAIDRSNRLTKLGGDLVIETTNNGYGGLRIYDDSSGDYNVHYIAGRNQGATAHVFSVSGRTQNQTPWASVTPSEIVRLTHTNGISFQGDTNTFIGKYTGDSQGDHLRVVTNGKDRLHISKRGSIVAPKLGTKAIQWSSCTNKWASSRSITQFMMDFYAGNGGATYHFMRMISQNDWGFEDVEVKQTRFQYSPDSGDHATFRYYGYYGGHTQETINYNQRGGTSSGNASNWIGTQYFGPGNAHQIHQSSNGGYYRDLWGTDFYVQLGSYIGVRLEIKVYMNSGVYDTGIYATASDFYPAAFGANATQSAADSHNGGRGIWFNTTSNGTGTGTAPVVSTSNADTGWSSGVNYLDVSA